MKKIYFSILLASVVGLSSCSMDEKPYGPLDDQTAIEDSTDLARFANVQYGSLRSMTSGAWIYRPDIQMDEFHGLISNGNREGIFSNSAITPSTSETESFYASCYSVIATSNELIEKAKELTANTTDTLRISNSMAVGYFTRAFAYFWIADHFCQSYTQTDPNAAHSGAQIVTTYNPTGNTAAYPGRSTLAETYSLIESDLNEAYNRLKAYENAGNKTAVAPNATLLSSYTVEAMQARVALVKGDWQTALDKAKDVINSGVYTLTPIADYNTLWTSDTGSEIIFQPFMNTSELGGSTGEEYISDSETSADYIPTFDVLAMYDDGDARFNAFFKVYNQLDVNGTKLQAYVLNKWPGNTTLRTGTTNNIVNMTKPFRLSEMYLIAAEADARLNNAAEGSQFLNTLRTARITGYTAGTYNANTLLSEVLSERKKELIGEGFRMSDLRRTGQGFTRYASHRENPNLDQFVVARGRSISYTANDYRYTWPLPKTEFDTNPNLAGQQNPGY